VAEIDELHGRARRLRGELVRLSHSASTPHLGGALSCADIVVAAYWSALNVDPERPEDPDRDRFVFSKGHAVTALYSALAQKGFFPEGLLDTFNEPGGKLPEQPSPHTVPGLEVATGSLGHGLPVGVGMALAGRITKRDYRVYVVMSDGECNEGTVWEAAMMASARRLENMMVVVDFNRWQATARSTEVMALEPLAEKFRAFGWSTCEVDGHDLQALADVMGQVPNGSGKPVAVVAHTVKGKGVSFMEDDNNWHYRIPTEEELHQARRELGLVTS
jgi:transketolase